jgi:formate dehydrogenase subunit gamma
MDEKENIKNKIDEEVESRLKIKVDQLKSQLQAEVAKEFEAKEKKSAEKETGQAEPFNEPEQEKYYVRFRLNFRLQHIGLLTTTIMLILTGIPLKFPKNGVSQFIIDMFGGTAGARSVHHFFALGMIAVGIYHLLYIFWNEQGRKDFFELLPRFKDFTDVINQLKRYLGLRKEKVRYRRFSYVEKFDYWAVYWGLVMMIGTGTIMWLFQGKFTPMIFGEIDLPFGPQIVTNSLHAICREMHSDEALLATLVIICWHFYNVHLNPHKFPMSKVWLNGLISEKEMKEDHFVEYREMIAKQKQLEADKENTDEKEIED